MSTEEKPLPDFSRGPTDAGETVAPVKGLPRAPRSGRRVAEPSAFTIIESDEVSRTLDFGMSEEDLEDVNHGEGSSSDLHDSLRALQGSPGVAEDSFATLSSNYESGVREEDTYKKPAPDAELPPLEISDELPALDESSELPPLETPTELPPLEDKPVTPVSGPVENTSGLPTSSGKATSSAKATSEAPTPVRSEAPKTPVATSSAPPAPLMTRRERRLQEQEQALTDISNNDEAEKNKKSSGAGKAIVKRRSASAEKASADKTPAKKAPAKKAAVKKVEKSDANEKKISPKLLIIVGAVLAAALIAFIVVMFVIPGFASPEVTAPVETGAPTASIAPEAPAPEAATNPTSIPIPPVEGGANPELLPDPGTLLDPAQPPQ